MTNGELIAINHGCSSETNSQDLENRVVQMAYFLKFIFKTRKMFWMVIWSNEIMLINKNKYNHYDRNPELTKSIWYA